ncbi:MAG: 2OG-Fe(II) oxygenase [Myxococcaceae bacterium]
MRALALQRRKFNADVVKATREALLSSPLLDRSPLYGTFRATRGFAAIFRRDGVETLKSRLPELTPFIDCVLSDDEANRLVPWLSRPFLRAPPTNAYYLNVLAVPPGAEVARHVDATLRTPSGDPTAIPTRVSVLYLVVPKAMRGGELRLHEGSRKVADVRPREGTLVHFRGDLAHEVLPFTSDDPSALRLSVVCEQYALSEGALERLDPFRLQSKAPFDAYVRDHQRRA